MDELVSGLGEGNNATDYGHLEALASQELVKGGLVLELHSCGFELVHLGLEETAETDHLGPQLSVLLLEGGIVNSPNGQFLKF